MNLLFPVAIGVVLAGLTILFIERLGGRHRRVLYALLLVGIAGLYVLFALRVPSAASLGSALGGVVLFALFAVLGVRRSWGWLVAGLLLHGAWDVAYRFIPFEAGEPPWYPEFCLVYDWAVAAYLAGPGRPRGAKTNPRA